MITCYSLNGKIYNEGIKFNNLDNIYSSLKNNLNLLRDIPIEVIILLLDEYSKKICLNKDILKIEGAAFLSFYFKRKNIDKLINDSLGDKSYLDKFIEKGNGKFIKAQGRGIACHWIAGNVPTLMFYSIFQAIIAKNSNIVRVPKANIKLVLKLMEPLKDIEIECNSKKYSSKDILKNISLVYFNSSDKLLNENMSRAADIRIIWGGEQAVNVISSLQKKTTCKDVIFGPKYSFAVFDKGVIESKDCSNYMDRFVKDVAVFEQKACTSPQVLFIEKSKIPLDETMKKLCSSFEKLNKRYPNILDESTSSKIINTRGQYSLSLNKNLYCSKGLDYTILINNEISLEEPLGGRCLFVKEIESVFDIKNLITNRIQTIGVAFKDKNKMVQFGELVTPLGADRVVSVGLMNIYDYPWDGYFVINELVRWCAVNTN
ncbi:acyl-CoA reductase [Clostridium drakei]|uniref:Acyl-CoA reductase n=1 Tax=Clostridium drakei TaxID=332101 RepID=A0A2U8DKL3_9CLOT|nr:acyl-CoA reductase [Clostridium drakei]AWI03237.1 acyl-CoA reductase [Clostridium drakei]